MSCCFSSETRRETIHGGSTPRAYRDVGGRATHGAAADTLRVTVSEEKQQLIPEWYLLKRIY